MQPDFHGIIEPGDMIYIPHGWLHDVIVLDDSISVTWNFVQRSGSAEFADYLTSGPEDDSEFEILQFFHRHAGLSARGASDIHALHFADAS